MGETGMSESRLPVLFRDRLRAAVIAAPMFLVSFPPVVLAICKAGIAGCFSDVNARSSEVFDIWLSEMTADLAAFARANPDPPVGPIGVNLVVHPTNPRFAANLKLVVEHQVPLVIEADRPLPILAGAGMPCGEANDLGASASMTSVARSAER